MHRGKHHYKHYTAAQYTILTESHGGRMVIVLAFQAWGRGTGTGHCLSRSQPQCTKVLKWYQQMWGWLESKSACLHGKFEDSTVPIHLKVMAYTKLGRLPAAKWGVKIVNRLWHASMCLAGGVSNATLNFNRVRKHDANLTWTSQLWVS